MEGERSHHTPALTTTTDGGSKLKVPKSTGEAEAEAPTPVKKSNFCHICSKRFSNGKAFGSHLSSADVQNREKLKKLKFNQSIKFKRDGSASFNTPAKGTVCIICGKDFPSKKSLFGDMRCHPERQYRDNMTYYHDVDVAAACATLTAKVAAVDLTDQSLSRKHDGDDQLISLVNGDALHLNPKEEHKSASSKLYGNKNKFSSGQELDEMQIEPQNHNLVVKKSEGGKVRHQFIHAKFLIELSLVIKHSGVIGKVNQAKLHLQKQKKIKHHIEKFWKLILMSQHKWKMQILATLEMILILGA